MSRSRLTQKTARTTDGPTPIPGSSSPTRTIRVALAGCGTVGSEVVRTLRDRGAILEAGHGLRFELVRILVRDPHERRPDHVPADLLTDDLAEFLETDAELVVEAIGGTDPALRIARHALEQGRGFVTANKALIATHGAELATIARERDASLSYEAAVAGGVPVVRALRESLQGADIESIRGILNGTTNYVLTRMEEGLSFQQAVAEAQAAGFAEADPTRDLSGQDAADKIAILAWQTFGIPPSRLRVRRAGLLPDPEPIIDLADALGGTARLMAECVHSPGGLTAAVEPVIASPGSALGRAAAEENVVEVVTRSSGTVRLAGPGAGAGPTAAAVVSDIVSAAPAPGGEGDIDNAVDTRRLRWVLSLRGTDVRPVLSRAAGRARVEIEDLLRSGSGSLHVLTEPVPAPQALLLTRTLEAGGLQPVLVRREWEG